jgi:sigma54-dependent transcription regulator
MVFDAKKTHVATVRWYARRFPAVAVESSPSQRRELTRTASRRPIEQNQE